MFEARHDRLTGRFAVKLFTRIDAELFLRNAQLASALRHPGIVQVIDYGASEGFAFVVMEYVEGETLSHAIAESGPMPAQRVVRLVDAIAGALGAAHAQGMAHGHLAPGHIFVTHSGAHGETAKVVAFGLGEEVSGSPDIQVLTPYTAPEQLSGTPDPPADQFALGAIAYEMLTGFAPFDDSTERQDPPSIGTAGREVNVVLDDVIRRALSSDPGDRWPEVAVFAERLREAGDGALEEKTRLATLPPEDEEPPIVLPAEAPVLTTIGWSTAEQPQAAMTPVEVDLGTPPPSRPTSRTPTAWPPEASKTVDILDRWDSSPPSPAFAFSNGRTSAALAAPMVPTKESRSMGVLRLVVMAATAALVALAAIKLDFWNQARTLVGRIAGGSSSERAVAAPAPTHMPPPEIRPIGTPTPPVATAAVPAGLPEVVPILHAPEPVAPPAPTKRSTRSQKRPAALPPDLAAAEEALLSGKPLPEEKSTEGAKPKSKSADPFGE